MEWLRRYGYHHLLANAYVAINHVAPGKPSLDVDDLPQQFEHHVGGGRVVVLPWDKHIAEGTEIEFDQLSSTFRRQIVVLAAALSDGFYTRRHALHPQTQLSGRRKPQAPRASAIGTSCEHICHADAHQTRTIQLPGRALAGRSG